MVQNISMLELFDVPASLMQPVGPSVISVTSSFIQNIALAVIGNAESKLSKRSMERLYELTRENNEANMAAFIQRINMQAQKACGASHLNNI